WRRVQSQDARRVPAIRLRAGRVPPPARGRRAVPRGARDQFQGLMLTAGAPRIVLNGIPTELAGIAPTTTLLDWLREHQGLRGTKEGCAEGDCGACTVVIERCNALGQIERTAINACLAMVGQLDGLGVRTVEGLSRSRDALHPLQAAFVETA